MSESNNWEAEIKEMLSAELAEPDQPTQKKWDAEIQKRFPYNGKYGREYNVEITNAQIGAEWFRDTIYVSEMQKMVDLLNETYKALIKARDWIELSNCLTQKEMPITHPHIQQVLKSYLEKYPNEQGK